MNIREIIKSDSEQMLKLNLRLDEESDYMLFEPNERSSDVDVQSKIIEGALKDKTLTWLVAFGDDGALQGYCVISCKFQKRNRHIGSLVVGISRSHQSKGIGFKLLDQALTLSCEKGVKRVELTVRSDNDKAIALYKKCGFVQEGIRSKSMYVNGRFYDELYMAKV